jgi:hypothetical protein
MNFLSRLFVAGATLLTICAAWSADNSEGWAVVFQSPDLTIHERARGGSPCREIKAVGTIEAEPAVVKRVLEDVSEFPSFMPSVVEARVLSTNGDTRLIYERLSLPLVDDRDYTLRLQSGTQRAKDGAAVYFQRWTTANDLGPAEKKGVMHVKVAEGSWLLEPAAGGHTTATYISFSDPGGKLPAFLTNKAGRETVRKLFAAIRKQARLPKYAGK